MNQINKCYLCKNKGQLFDFKKNNYFCNECLNLKFKHSLTLNECEIIKDLTDCNKKFEKYQWLSEMSSEIGQSGYIFIVYNINLDKKTILKVQRYTRDDQEMRVSCAVSDFTNFVKTIDYFICDEYPVSDIWKKSNLSKFIADRNDKLFYIEMEKYEGTLKNLIDDKTPLTNHDKLSICFELFNALLFAWNEIGFEHRDFHNRNIFYKFEKNERNYTIDIETKDKKRKQMNITCASLFYPVIGDFGSVWIHKGKYKRLYEVDYIGPEKRKIQIDVLQILLDLDTELFTWRWIYDYRDNGRYLNVPNKEFLEFLGKLVIESPPPNKRQRIL